MTRAQPDEWSTDGQLDDQAPRPRFRSRAVASRGVARDLGPPMPAPRLNPLAGLRLRDPRQWWGALRAWLRRPRRVPVRIQVQNSDCGPACLAMVLAYHGIDVDLEQLRRDTNAGRDGVSARTLLDTAHRYGLGGRGVRCTMAGLAALPAGSLLFWNFGHFVVLERVSASHVHVIDPAFGRRRIPNEVVDESFTGVALEFSPPLTGRRSWARPVGERLTRSHWRHLAFFFPRSRAWVPLIVTSLILLTANLVVPLATAYVADNVTIGRSPHGLPFLIGALPCVTVVFLFLQLSRALAILAMQSTSDTRVTLGVLNHLLSLPYEFFAPRAPGDLAMRVRTSTAVRQILTNSAMSTMFDGVLILVYMALLLLADRPLAFVVIGLAFAQVAVLLSAWRRQESLTTEALEAQSRAQGELQELLEGLGTLKAAGLDAAAGERWSHSFAEEVNSRVRSRRSLTMWSGISLSIQFGAPLVVLLVGSLRVGAGELSLGSALAFATLAMGLFVPLANLVQTGLQVSGIGATLARMSDILRTTPENTAELPTVERVTGELAVRNAGYAYPGSALPALRDVDLTVRPGEFVAVLGASGSGKSTLAMLLSGLCLPTSGQILVDGRPTSELNRASLRTAISFVSQDTRLFAGSIRDNISWGEPNATLGDVRSAAMLAEIHQDIRALPMRYDTLLAAGGVGLSGGQRQRIALARALLRKPRLIILDEATSALDPELERRIFANLLGLECTLVAVAHRLTTLARANQIIVVEGGRIVRRGTPADFAADDLLPEWVRVR